MKQFLNKEIQKFRDISSEEEKELRKVFKKCVDLSKVVFGEFAFKRFICGNSERKPQGQWERRKVNRALFDLIMYGFSRYEKNQIIPRADIIREELIALMTRDEGFMNSILFTTDKTEKVNLRFKKWLQSLEEIVGLPKTEKRNFSLEFKEQLWKNNPTCRICGQRINVLDDAEIDHVEHYWRGGETIPSNARLTHRYCNRARGGRGYEVIPKSNISIDKETLSKPAREANLGQAGQPGWRSRDNRRISAISGGGKLILEFLTNKGDAATMNEIADYMHANGYSSNTFYDWSNGLVAAGVAIATKKNGRKAYQVKDATR